MGHVQTWVLLRPISTEPAETGMVSAAASGYGHGDATVRPLMRAFSRGHVPPPLRARRRDGPVGR